MRQRAMVISRPTPQYWQVLGLGISNLGRSFGERSLSSFHRGFAERKKCRDKRCAICNTAPCDSRQTLSHGLRERLRRHAESSATCERHARGGQEIGDFFLGMLHKTGQDAAIESLQLV